MAANTSKMLNICSTRDYETKYLCCLKQCAVPILLQMLSALAMDKLGMTDEARMNSNWIAVLLRSCTQCWKSC